MNIWMLYNIIKKNDWNREKRNYRIDFFEYLKLINANFTNIYIITRQMYYSMW